MKTTGVLNKSSLCDLCDLSVSAVNTRHRCFKEPEVLHALRAFVVIQHLSLILRLSMPRSVLFVDPPAFCTTVEELVAPALRNRPIVVAPPGADRAAVLALSAEARLAGIERGMPVRRAQKLSSDLVLLPPNPQLYARASQALHEILRIYAPIIEPHGYGHAFLDLTGTGRLFGPAADVASRVRREVRERLCLPISVGVAANKLVSQAATTVVKPEPLLEVASGNEAEFLAPYPLEVLPDIHPWVRSRLDDYQLDLIGELAAISETVLCTVFGGVGSVLKARARGIDPRPVLPPERRAEFHLAHSLATDTNDLGVLHPLLRIMSERLGRRLRRGGLVARRLKLEVAYSDHTAIARAFRLPAAALDVEIWDAARRVFTLANTKRIAVRSIALTLDRLEEAEVQLELWEDGKGGKGGKDGKERMTTQLETLPPFPSFPSLPPSRPAALQHAIDRIRGRWGARGLMRGTTVLPQ